MAARMARIATQGWSPPGVAVVRAALMLWALAEPASPAPAAGAGVRSFVRPFGFSEADLASMEAGSVVTRVLDGDGVGDVAVVGLLYVRAPMAPLLEQFSEIRPFLTVGDPVQYGLFSDPARPGDVEGLRFDAGELRSARGCEPRDCIFKLDRAAMDRIARWRRRRGDGEQRLAELLKESMLEQVAAYRRDGSLPVYLDKKRPSSVADELGRSVDGSPYVDSQAPLLQYVLNYPRLPLSNTRDVFYWSSEKLRRLTASVHHLAIHRPAEGHVVRYAIADKHISDNHYFRARFEMLWLLAGRDDSGFYCVRLSRGRIDPPGWFTGIAMGRVRRATRSSLDRQLKVARHRLETSAPRVSTN